MQRGEDDVTSETQRVTLRRRPEALSFSPRLLGAALTSYSVQKPLGRKSCGARRAVHATMHLASDA